MTNFAEQAKHVLSDIDALIEESDETGGSILVSQNMAAFALSIPQTTLKRLEEKGLFLLLKTTPDNKLSINVCPTKSGEYQMDNIIKSPRIRLNLLQSWYLKLYGLTQQQKWEESNDLYQKMVKIMTTLKEKKVFAPTEFWLESDNITRFSSSKVSSVDESVSLLNALWSTLGKLDSKTLEQIKLLGFTPQNLWSVA